MKNVTILFLLWILTSCASYQVNESPPVDTQARWVIMPIINHSTTPMAGQQAEQIMSSILFNLGVKPDIYPREKMSDFASVLDERVKLETAQAWLQTQSFDYVITGTIQEWHYKTGLDGEPAVGVTLELIAVETGEVLWKSSGSRAGWGRESVSSAAHTVIENMLNGLTLK